MTTETSQTQFNMAAATLQRIDALLQKANSAYSKGLLSKWYFTLKAVKLNAYFKFSKDEKEDLRKLEIKYSKQTRRNFRWGIVERYNETLLTHMNKYGMLLPDKKDDINTAY